MRTLMTMLVCLLGAILLVAQEPAAKDAKIIFASTRSGNAEIYLASATGKGGVTNLSQHDAADVDPAWSPDGKRIVFNSDRDGAPNIFVMDADGKNVKQLTEEKVISRGPAWSPDGKKIAFTRHVDDGVPDIFVMDADGKNAVNLTNNPGYDADAAAEGLEIHVVDADGKNRKQLTKLGGQNSYATWSPDSKKIAFHHRSDETTAIYVMDADGGNATAIIMNAELPAEGGRIAWRPK
jgi:Tol biopolymer transport system component